MLQEREEGEISDVDATQDSGSEVCPVRRSVLALVCVAHRRGGGQRHGEGS